MPEEGLFCAKTSFLFVPKKKRSKRNRLLCPISKAEKAENI